MKPLNIGAALLLSLPLMADTVTLKNGHVVSGDYLGGSSREVKIDIGDKIQTIDVSDVDTIKFGSARRDGDSAAQSAHAGSVTLPAGTQIVIRMIDGVDSERNTIGQTFAASLDEPVSIDGETLIPRGADVVVKLVDEKESGKLTGRTTLTLDLVSVKVKDRVVDLN